MPNQNKKIAYVTNAAADSGIGYQAAALYQRLRPNWPIDLFHLDGQAGQLVTTVAGEREQRGRKLGPWPGILGNKTISWLRLRAELDLKVRSLGSSYVYHLTNQTLSFLNRRLHPSIVTVHDLIEVISPQSRGSGIAARYLYSGITRADQLIAVSKYTARTIHDYYTIPLDRIAVIYNGVDAVFHPIADFRNTIGYHTWMKELRLPPEARIVLMVSSDHERKNVATAVQVVAKARQRNQSVFFIKVGQPGIAAGRALTLAQIDRWHLRPYVRLLGSVSLEQLCELYNLADIVIHPSRFEGFGLPPLQAMACGTPVLVANSTSLPEVVGEAGLQHEPDDVDGFVDDILHLLSDNSAHRVLQEKGIAQAKHFSWDESAHQVGEIYRRWL